MEESLFKRVENTMGKGEIACYKQFLLLPQCFQKACFPGASKGVIVWEWLKKLLHTKFHRNVPEIDFSSSLQKNQPCGVITGSQAPLVYRPFSYSVFKRLLLPTHKKPRACLGKS